MSAAPRKGTAYPDLTAYREALAGEDAAPGDEREARARFNGPPAAFVACLARVAPAADPGAVARSVFDAWRRAGRKEVLRGDKGQRVRDAARAMRDDLAAERDALRRRLAASSAREAAYLGGGADLVLPADVFATAAFRRNDDQLAADPSRGWAAADHDRLDDLTARIAALEDALEGLAGRGRPAARLRLFADELAVIFETETGHWPTANVANVNSRSRATSPFAQFVKACVAMTTEEQLSDSSVASACASAVRDR